MLHDFNKTAIITRLREISYRELITRVLSYARLTPMGGKDTPRENTKVVIFSENREGWIYAFFAIWHNKAIPVPVDASSTASDMAYILRDCSPQAAWISHSQLPLMQEAIRMAGVDTQLLFLDDYEDAPLVNADQAVQSTPQSQEDKEKVALIIYTSGTTGSPKGVMLTYNNLYANISGVSDEVPIFNSERRALILLPLHHVLPLMGTLIAPILRGGGVAICPSMSAPDIMDTLCRGKVAIFIGVPRLWQMLFSGIKKKIDASPVTRGLFSLCQNIGSYKVSRIIFSAVHKKLGGHIAYCVSGGAALDPQVASGLKTLGLKVLEGYGMTETAPIIAFTRPDDIIPGCVGLPLPSVHCKLQEGELLAKGPNVMMGYYNRPEETSQVIDSEGYIHTGDLAEIDNSGRIRITGRKKEIIVLSNGKNVQPYEIEFQLEASADKVKECAVTEQDDMLLAIIVPQPQWAEGRTDQEIQAILKREVIEPYNLTVENYKKVMRIFVSHEDLPRTRLDKIQRFRLKDFIAGRVTKEEPARETIDESLLSDDFRILRTYIRKEKHIDALPTSHIETDLAFDSLDRVSLQGFIEHTFGVAIDAAEMLTYRNLGEIADHITRLKTRTDVEDVDWSQLLRQDHSAQLTLPHASLMLTLGRKLFKAFLKTYNSLSIHGRENIPQKGPYIIAANHQSYLDGPIVCTGLTSASMRSSYFYATENHVKGALLKCLARNNNVIIMERKNLKNSILKLAEVLKMGRNVIIFPEGRRTSTGEMDDFRKMFAILSIELGVPIIPVAINGAYEAMPREKGKLRPTHIDVTYLPAIEPHGDYDTLTQEVRQAIADAIN